MSKEKDVIALFKQASPFFIALGDEHRQQIVARLLQTYRMSVNEIADDTDLSRPAVSHHLKILKDAGLISVQRSGTQRFYHIDEAAVVQLDLLDQLTTALRNCTNWQENN
jgi:ArsR family transcriptional regulator, arsenate/arsenite/antimonite-responsive transcriptional repressor